MTLEIDSMKKYILAHINKNYKSYIKNDCFDIVQLKNICMLYKLSDNDADSISLDDVNISSPYFNKSSNKKNRGENIIESNEFKQRYKFFIKIMYALIKLDIEIFDIDDDILTIKNNYNMLKSINESRKFLTSAHITELKKINKYNGQFSDSQFEKSVNSYVKQMKILDKIVTYFNKIINNGIIKKTDSLLTLLLPFFYKYIECIEEYGYRK